MGFGDRGLDLRHAFDQRGDRAVFVALVDRPHFGGGVDDADLVTVELQHQVDHPEVRAPEATHHRGFAVDRAVGGVEPVPALVIGAGEDEVGVPGHQRVDPVDLGERDGGVFHALFIGGRADAGMRERHDDLRAFFLHLRHPGLGGFHDVARGDVAFEVAAVPGHDLRRHEADEADFDGMLGAGTVDDRLVEDHIGLHQGLVGGRRSACLGGDVGADHREGRAGQGLHQEVETVVELVVAEGRGVEAHGVHRGDDRVDIAFGHALFIGHVIAHRVALQEVAVVEQHRVGGLGANVGDMGGGAGEAHRVDRFVAVIVIGHDMDVQVGRLHQPQMRLARGRPGRERMQQDETATGNAGQEPAAGGGKDG